MGTVGYLLDTHTFLWAVHEEGSKLSENARRILSTAYASICVSAASAYEIMNKYRIGKLPDYAHVADNFLKILNEFGAGNLPVSVKHAHCAGKMEWNHRDPFDRMLAAQAIIDNLTLITSDPVFQSLPKVTTLW
jgi:PIN domain nuclease of toxin-antitoxin system